jgi:hypothetical protein
MIGYRKLTDNYELKNAAKAIISDICLLLVRTKNSYQYFYDSLGNGKVGCCVPAGYSSNRSTSKI